MDPICRQMVVRLFQKILSIKEPQARVAFLMDIFGRDWPRYYDYMMHEIYFINNSRSGLLRRFVER
jgi:hypothetical protein